MWETYLLNRLPTDDAGNILLREVQTVAVVRGQAVTTVVCEVVEPSKLIELFGDALGHTPPDGPLSEETYQAILAKADTMGSPLWRQRWEMWRAEGRI